MEVVPTSDGEEDDGVIWFRCPQCQGFLPKLGGIKSESEKDSLVSSADSSTVSDETARTSETSETSETTETSETSETGEALPWDSPADMMAARKKSSGDASPADLIDSGEDKSTKPADSVHEYAALLAEKDQSQPTPYRPWESYEVGQCIHHQAWEDCGVVVAKEDLPGGRQVIKCYFEEAGVVRLIEQAPK